MLFGPALRTDYVAKFIDAGADIGVLDFEDATPESQKANARDAVVDALPGALDLGEMLFFVRVNPLGTKHFAEDVRAGAAAQAGGIIVPKLETDREVEDVRREMAKADLVGAMLCAGIESVAGVHRAVEIAGAGVDLVYFGAEDYVTDLGGVRTESNSEVLLARSQVSIAARLAGVPALDQVTVDFTDGERFTTEAVEARSLGYEGKLCIHPSQVPLANAAFTPSDEEMAWASGVVAAADEAERDGLGVVAYEGTMVDAPIVTRARKLLNRYQI